MKRIGIGSDHEFQLIKLLCFSGLAIVIDDVECVGGEFVSDIM